MDTNGIITTVAGMGHRAIPAMAARPPTPLDFPTGVALDAAGNIYIADQLNARIRRVETNGVITTVAGEGNAAFLGDGSAATNAILQHPRGVTLDAADNLYIADQNNNLIRKVDTSGIITTVAGSGPFGFGFGFIPVTAARPPMPDCPTPPVWPWMTQAISILRTCLMRAFAR